MEEKEIINEEEKEIQEVEEQTVEEPVQEEPKVEEEKKEATAIPIEKPGDDEDLSSVTINIFLR